MHNLSKRYFYFICFFMMMTNNVSAVKSVIHPAQKMETISDSIPSELILTHRSYQQRLPKIIRPGQKLKVRTKDKKTYRGRLKVIDENYIEVAGQKIATENIARVKHKNKQRKMFIGLGFILSGIVIAVGAAATASGDTFANYALNYFLALIAIFLIIPIGLIILAFPVVYSAKSWLFNTELKDGVLYRRNDP